MTPLVVRIVPIPAATLVTICGEVDLATIAQLRGRLCAVPDRDTVVEMSEVGLLCAAGVRAVLALQDRLAAAGARLVLAAASHPVRRVLTVTGSDRQLVMTPTVDDALTSLQTSMPNRAVSALQRWRTRTGSAADDGRVACGIRESVSRELLSAPVPGAVADPSVRRLDGGWSQEVDQCSASVTRDGAPPPVLGAG